MTLRGVIKQGSFQISVIVLHNKTALIRLKVDKIIWIPAFTGMAFPSALFSVIPAKAGIQFFVCINFQLIYERTDYSDWPFDKIRATPHTTHCLVIR